MLEENLNNAYCQLFIRLLIKFGIADLSQIELSKLSLQKFRKNLLPKNSEIQLIQTMITNSSTNSIDGLKLKYFLEKGKLELPTLFEITASFIKNRDELNQAAQDTSKVGEDVSEKFVVAKDSPIEFLEITLTSYEMHNAIIGIVKAPYFYQILFLLSECFGNDSQEIKKTWNTLADRYNYHLDLFLNLACAYGTTRILTTFIADIDRVFKDETLSGHPNAVRFAAKQRIIILEQLLIYASKYGHLEVVKFWFASDLAIDSNRLAVQRAFHWACSRGHDQIVACMLAKNPLLVKSRDDLGRIGLDLAAIHAHEKVLDVLLAYKTPTTNISKNSENIYRFRIITSQYIDKISDKNVKENFIRKLSQADTPKSQSIQKTYFNNNKNYLFPLVPAILFFASLFSLLLVDVKLFQYWYPLPLSLLVMTLCCGLPIMIYRNNKERLIIKELLQEKKDPENSLEEGLLKKLDNEKQDDETISLLPENSSTTSFSNVSSYGSINQEISVNIIPMPVRPTEKSGKEEENMISSAEQSNARVFSSEKTPLRYLSLNETGNEFKKNVPAPKEPYLPSGDPEDSEFGGIVHCPSPDM